MIFHLSRTCRIISNKLKFPKNIFIYKGLCSEKARQPKKIVINLGILQKRNYHGFWRKPSIHELKEKDGVPGDYKLIYRNKMDNYLWYIQMITTTTATLMVLKMMSSEGLNFKALPELINDKTFEQSDSFTLMTFFIVAVVLLQSLVYKMPIRIYNCPQLKKYQLVFYGNMPFTQKTFSCKAGEVIEYSQRSLSPWRDQRYLLNSDEKRIVYLFEQYFHRSADLHIMMGLQDDPDFEDKEKPSNSNK